MKKHQLCCIGHITLDKVVTPQNTVYMPGGTAFYCSHAIRHFNDIDYALVTAVGATEMDVVEQLREMGIHVTALPSKYSVYFENIYGANPDDRTQRVLAKADPSGCILRRIHDPIPANTNRHLRSRGFACRHQQCEKLLGRRLLGVFI